MKLRLVRLRPRHLPGFVAALERGWSPDNLRGPADAGEALAAIAADRAKFLAATDDPEGVAGDISLPDGSTVQRLPGLHRWL